MKIQAKRVDIVTIKMVKESSVLYKERHVSSPKKAYELVKPFLTECDREHFVVAYLDTKNQPTAIHTVSIGSLSAAIVHPREIFVTGILSKAAGIILSHNHPSGNPNPSSEDISITERLVKSGEILGIKVMDHIITGDDESYYSFKENEMI